jgi:transposase
MWEAQWDRTVRVSDWMSMRSVVACGLDGKTGELFERRLTPGPSGDCRLVQSLPGPVAVTDEAGLTGFGLSRFLTMRGIAYLVAAPSKVQRPGGDRVKTDLRDARSCRCRGRPGRGGRSRAGR